MAVSGKTATYQLPYFLGGDSPPDMAAVTKAISERVEALLAKGGDVSIAADGTITIGPKKVVSSMVADTLKPSAGAAAGTEALRALGTTASTAAAGNDGRLSDERTPKANSVNSGKIEDGGVAEADLADGAATSRKTKLTTAQATCSSSLTLGAGLADVPGCSVTVSLAVKSTVVVIASWLFELTNAGAGNGATGSLFFDGADQVASGQAIYKGNLNQPELRTLAFLIPQEAGSRTIKMRAQCFSGVEGKVLTGSGGATRMVCFPLAA